VHLFVGHYTRDLPVTVGVFIRPGDVPLPMSGTMGRRNRCFEYDAVGDTYVHFLTEELLPFVAKTFDLKLSTNGNNRCIAGGQQRRHCGVQRRLGAA